MTQPHKWAEVIKAWADDHWTPGDYLSAVCSIALIIMCLANLE